MNERVQIIDPRESEIVAEWRKGHLSLGTIINYLYWVRRFRKYCEKQQLIEAEQLTLAGLEQFLHAYTGSRLKGRSSAQNSCAVARNAFHAWACALRDLGTPLPRWREKSTAPLQAGVDVSVIRDYLGHSSVATTSRYITTNLQMKREVLEAF